GHLTSRLPVGQPRGIDRLRGRPPRRAAPAAGPPKAAATYRLLRACAILRAARGQLNVQPQPTIRDVLADRAKRGFVGRGRELALLDTLLGDDGPLVLHLRGAPGVGKTRLLDMFAARARARGATIVRLDGHAIEPTETGFRHALASAPSGSASE